MINTFGWMRVNDDFCIYFYFYFFIIYKVKALRLCVLDTGGKDVHVKMCVYIYIYIYIYWTLGRETLTSNYMYVCSTYILRPNQSTHSVLTKQTLYKFAS